MAEFRYLTELARGMELLAQPPTHPRVVRPESHGQLVASCALPLSMCPTTNGTRGRPGWSLGMLKKDIGRLMKLQIKRRNHPLPGRPEILCTRFSCSEPDKYADWAKMAIDWLGRKGANLIYDDAPGYCEVHQWWEPAERGSGFVLIRVFEGEAE